MRFLKLLLAALPFLYIVGCTPPAPRPPQPVQWVPATSGAVLKINETEQFRSDFRNSTLFKSLLENQENAPWWQALDTVLALDPPSGSLLITADPTQPPGAWLLLIPGMERAPDSLSEKENVDTDGIAPVPSWQLPDSTGFFFRVHKGLGMLATSESYLEQVLENGEAPPPGLKKALQAASPVAQATLLLPPGAPDPYTGRDEKPLGTGEVSAGTWSAYDFQSGPGALVLQSMEVTPDSLNQEENLLRGLPGISLQRVARLIPAEATTWIAYSLGSREEPLKNQPDRADSLPARPPLSESMEQLSLVENDGDLILVMHSANPSGVEEALKPLQGDGTEFQGVLVYPLNETGELREAFAPLLDRWPLPSYYCILEDAFILTESFEGIQAVISAHNRGATFDKEPRFQKLNPLLASSSSSLFISEDPTSSKILSDSLAFTGMPREFTEKLPKGYLVTAQLDLEDSFSLRTFQFRDAELLEDEKPQVSEIFTATLEAPAQSRPQFLKNHLSGEMDVAVQDENNTLYLFSNGGTLFWKKELPGPIQGDIHQVDLFRNGRLQMAFTTNDKLMVLDRNGKEVAPFPKDFPGGNLGPLAVFDYEQNRNYRLVVTQGAKVFMFDGQGNDVRGFKFRDAGSPVISAPKHIRIGNRDYLVFQLENGQLRILNRVGDTRVPVRERFEFSANPVFHYRDGFAFSERNGNLVRIDTRGRVSRTQLNLNPEHGMDATLKTLAFMDDNRFQVKGNRRELELGVYTRPRIFYLNDIIYVAVTDLQSQQVYLFRSTAAPVAGFPVEGSGPADMADMDNGRNPELVVPYRDNAIRVYRIRR